MQTSFKILLLTILLSCAIRKANSQIIYSVPTDTSIQFIKVSLDSLLNNISKFENGIWIEFDGEIVFGEEAFAIFSKKPITNKARTYPAIWLGGSQLQIDISKINHQYCKVRGWLNKEKHGHSGWYYATIEDIRLIKKIN